MAAVVTKNSAGTGVTGAGVSTLSPVPPISNCLGKRVVLVFAAATTAPTITSISGATYYLCSQHATDCRLAVYAKDGEAVEPTPMINIGTPGTVNMGAIIFVLDIAGGSFPTIAGAGQGVLAEAHNSVTAQTTSVYNNLTVVGGGFLIQFGVKATTGAGWTYTSVDVTAAHTFLGAAVKTSGAANIVVHAQLKDAATVFGSDAVDTYPSVNTNTSSTNVAGVTVEFSVNQGGGGGKPFTGKFGAPFNGKIAA